MTTLDNRWGRTRHEGEVPGSFLGWYDVAFWRKPAVSVLTGKRHFIPGVAKTRQWLVDSGCVSDLVDAKDVSHLHWLVRPTEHQPTLWTASGGM